MSERTALLPVTRYKVGWHVGALVGGVAIALLVLYYFRTFSNTYATFLVVATMGPFLIFVAGNTKLMLWGLLTVCLPITVDVTLGDTGHIGGTAGYVISAFDMVLAILYLLWIVEMVRDKSIQIRFFPQITIPAMLLMVIGTATMAFARFPELSKFELIEVLKMYLAFLYLANNVRNERELRFLVTCLLGGLIFSGVIGIAQHRYSEPFWPTSLGGPREIDSRVTGTWVSYNDFAWYLTFVLPLALSLLFSPVRPYYKYACGLALAFAGGSLIWTNSRAGWVSLAIAAIFVVVFAFCKMRGKWSLIRTVLSIIVITVLISPLYPRLSGKLYSRFFGDDKGSAESRLPQFEVAYNMFKANPITGIGLNNYTAVMADYDSTQEGLETITQHAVHNIYLHIIAEMGIFGGAIFLWIVTQVFIEGMRGGAAPDGVVSYTVVGLLGGLIAFLLHGLIDTASLGSKLFMFLWFFAGIIFAATHLKTTTAPILTLRRRQ